MATLDWIDLGVVLVIALASGRYGAAAGVAIFRRTRRLARRRVLATTLVGITAATCSASLSIRDWPVPQIPDEFSYLLAADTFASGRLTNPTHPMWKHFETYHVIQRPTYASKYPPGQGFALALGQWLGGHPAVGVWISFGAASSALCWMLQAWVPPVWAFIGALDCALNVWLVRYWGDTYWGGAVAMLGGALLFGAAGRLRTRPTTRDALIFGAGIILLENSRPFEGMIVVAAASVAVIVWQKTSPRVPIRLLLERVVAPLVVVVLLGGAWMAYYDWRVTGNPMHQPYFVHEDAYNPVPLFFFQNLRAMPSYRHPRMESAVIGYPIAVYRDERAHPLNSLVAKLRQLRTFFLPPLLGLPVLVTLPGIARDSRVRFAALVSGLLLGAIGLETYCFPHYVAPATCLLAIPIVRAMRVLRTWRFHGRRAGVVYVLCIPLVCAIAGLVSPWFSPRIEPDSPFLERARLLEVLDRDPGKHLVIVHYDDAADPFTEWVYNRADIDGTKVICVREMSASENDELLRYFRDRHLWRAGPGSVATREAR